MITADLPDEPRIETDIRALIAEIQSGRLQVRMVGPKILEVARPGCAPRIMVGSAIFDSEDFIKRQAGTRGLITIWQ